MAALKSVLFFSLSAIVLIIVFGSETVASCSQPLASSTCYRNAMYVSYRTVYSKSSRVSHHACGWWGWERCSRTHYSQISSQISVMTYRSETYCCNGYIRIEGSCKPECNINCEAGYTCVAPNTCRRGVQLMLGGINYPNNSIIQFDSIFYTPDHCHSLLCTTDRVPCCSHPLDGNWYNVQPNGNFISVSQSMKSNYYQSRENDGTVRLIRQAESDTKQSMDFSYCCQLLDATSTMQTLCVTIAQYSPGVWLSLDGQLVPNNSAVELREVYETSDDIDSSAHTLMCVTPKRPCCKASPNRFGEWFYPNRSAVSIDGSGNSFYRDRGDDGTVRLHRRGITALSIAMGQYCCEIPNTYNVHHKLCIHFIDSSPGVWLMASKDGQVYPNNTIISLSEVFGTRYSLLCVTERRPCCSSSSGAGDWYYQNGTAVPNYGQTFAFYTSRGDDDGTVRLHARDNILLMNTSQFCCEILNINDLSQKLCVNICDSDCEIMSEGATTVATNLTIPDQTPSTKPTTSVGATVGYVVMGLALVIVCITVATVMILWKYLQLKAKTTTTNTEKSTDLEVTVEIQHNTAKHNISAVKETEAQEDGHDEINVYEDMNYEIHGMSICPAYGTIN